MRKLILNLLACIPCFRVSDMMSHNVQSFNKKSKLKKFNKENSFSILKSGIDVKWNTKWNIEQKKCEKSTGNRFWTSNAYMRFSLRLFPNGTNDTNLKLRIYSIFHLKRILAFRIKIKWKTCTNRICFYKQMDSLYFKFK